MSKMFSNILLIPVTPVLLLWNELTSRLLETCVLWNKIHRYYISHIVLPIKNDKYKYKSALDLDYGWSVDPSLIANMGRTRWQRVNIGFF